MIINKIIGILVIIALMASISTAIADVEVTVDSVTVDNTGDTAIINITAKGVENLSEFAMYLEYDTSVVSVTGGENNPDIPDTYGLSNFSDDGCLDLGSTGPVVSLSGDVTLVTITLEAVGAPCDQCTLNLTVNGMKDSNGDRITAITESDGTFTIACPGDDDDTADDDAADDDAADDDAADDDAADDDAADDDAADDDAADDDAADDDAADDDAADDDAADDDAADDDAADDDAADDDAADDDDTTEIPEFPSLVIPVVAILGLMFLLSRRK